MPETAFFSLKNCKNRPVLGYPPNPRYPSGGLTPIGDGIKGARTITGIF